ncbi:16S rRNA m(7)G-527 methyltransferase [Caldanaerobius fijiensis DSM 17918]|uniref:Ribosomal RNA small subunit methyltransferase G n=1 Tax=Caldanaerobius fijiensis DSM 17918 TaxID=1121256 RepID=A0A1M5APE4_9THEO|nr:16S rRNA (guanine(527)-N(7))-methyltransferase RsmG [Caldanaerobius fijiensis]SHF32123.1 16S rRNA m(7)G-527 methyltransferase [Caldanaerobius fijiensis DSM 17918]
MDDLKELLYDTCSSLGIELHEVQVEQLLKYMELLKEWNKKFNLTRITDDREVIIKHFADSLAIIKTGEVPEKCYAIDVGTGAGFPGIPLKIYYPEIHMTLLDSLKKRVGFLSEVIKQLNLKGIDAVHGRAEDIARDVNHRERYDLCLSRAVAPMNVLCEYCLPFLKVGGTMVAMKGRNVDEEIEDSMKALDILGGQYISTFKYQLPPDIIHCAVIVRKKRSTPGKYPRKAGTPEKNPL